IVIRTASSLVDNYIYEIKTTKTRGEAKVSYARDIFGYGLQRQIFLDDDELWKQQKRLPRAGDADRNDTGNYYGKNPDGSNLTREQFIDLLNAWLLIEAGLAMLDGPVPKAFRPPRGPIRDWDGETSNRDYKKWLKGDLYHPGEYPPKWFASICPIN